MEGVAVVDDEPAPARPAGRPLAVGYYCLGWPLEAFSNGIVTYTTVMAEAMGRLGHRAHVLAALVHGDDGAGRPDGPAVHSLADVAGLPWAARALMGRVSPRLAGPRDTAERLRRRAAGLGLDVLEVEESFGLAASVAGRVPMPVVVRLHGPWFLNGAAQGVDEDAAFRRRVRIEGRGIAAATAVTAPSADVLARVRARYGLDLAGAEVIPNPVPIPPAEQRWRAETCDPGLILFVGRFDPHKGGDVVVDAFALLAQERPGVRLAFVGADGGVDDGHGGRRSIAEYLGARAPELVGSGRFEWLGQRPHGDLAGLRLRAAAVVVASRYENFPTTVLEAAAQGCPLVATQTGGIPEIVRDGSNGLLCAPGDPRALAAALGRILDDRALAGRLGRAAALDCERRYAPSAVAARTAVFYDRVVAGVSGPARVPSRVARR